MSRCVKPLAVLLVFLCVVPTLFGASYDYIIDQYFVDINVGTDSVYQITETLDIDFLATKHGFFREIPIGYQGRQAKVSDIRVSERAQMETSRNYVTLQIGDPNRTVTGARRYSIQYLYDLGADGHKDYDEFYLNLVGEGWQVPIKDFQFRIVFPKPIDTDYIGLTRGKWGSTSSVNAQYTLSADRMVITGRATSLLPGEALTLRVQLSEGYFSGVRQVHDWTSLAGIVYLVASLLAIVLAFLIWSRWGRDKEPIIMARYDAPDGLTPLDVGYLADQVVDNKDITSMIFYWADRGYLSISESGKKSYVFTQLKEPVDATEHELELFHNFFRCGKNGVVTMSELEGKFGQYIEKTKRAVASYFTGERALTDPKSTGLSVVCGALAVIPAVGYAVAMTINYMDIFTLVLIGCGIFSMFMAGIFSMALIRKWYLRSKGANIALICVYGLICLLEWGLLAGVTLLMGGNISYMLVVGCSVVQVFAISAIMFLATITHKRSAYGQDILEQVLGLREFIDKVEMDKLRMMIDQDPMIFYHILSYAIVLGLENTWAKKFSSITIEPPTWYVGSNLVWDAMFYSSLARRWNTSFTATMPQSTSPRNPGMRFGGSSFGSSGFSGGGFGGGGGGAW